MKRISKKKKNNLIKKNKEQLPVWFYSDCNLIEIKKEHMAFVSLLNSSRQDFYTALSLYQVPVRYSTTMIVSIITVVGVTLSLAQNLLSPDICKKVEIFVAFLLCIAFLISISASFLITKYYNVYVSALLFSAQLHYNANIRGFEWFERLIEFLIKKGPNISRKDFIKYRTWKLNDSHFWYVVFNLMLGLSCLISAIGIFIFSPFSN